jgi:hypothetical protein
VLLFWYTIPVVVRGRGGATVLLYLTLAVWQALPSVAPWLVLLFFVFSQRPVPMALSCPNNCKLLSYLWLSHRLKPHQQNYYLSIFD